MSTRLDLRNFRLQAPSPGSMASRFVRTPHTALRQLMIHAARTHSSVALTHVILPCTHMNHYLTPFSTPPEKNHAPQKPLSFML